MCAAHGMADRRFAAKRLAAATPPRPATPTPVLAKAPTEGLEVLDGRLADTVPGRDELPAPKSRTNCLERAGSAGRRSQPVPPLVANVATSASAKAEWTQASARRSAACSALGRRWHAQRDNTRARRLVGDLIQGPVDVPKAMPREVLARPDTAPMGRSQAAAPRGPP